jgi:hypothetical protein
LGNYVGVPGLIYPKTDLLSAYKYLDDNTKADDVILADRDTSLLLPLYAKNTVYFGQSIYTANNAWKSGLTENFFAGKTDTCEEINFIRDGKIRYVIAVNNWEAGVLDNKGYLEKIQPGFGPISIYRFIQKGIIGC